MVDDSRPSSLQAAEKAIALLGGPVAAARRLEIERYQTVQSWLRNRVPAEYCPLIERATAGQVRCEELRPDIAWDVLRMQSGQEPWDGSERRAPTTENTSGQ